MAEEDQEVALFVEYYQRPFFLMHQQLKESGYTLDTAHPVRAEFWRLLPYRQYAPHEARPLVDQYLRTVEQALSGLLGRQSLAYWLHLYRRLAPDPIGPDGSVVTVGLVRAALEAAIQKHASFSPCRRVGLAGDTPVEDVLGGALMAPEFEPERRAFQAARLLVLTEFSTLQLREFYDIEKLAYELWRSSAMRRIIGKGSPIVVDGSQNECVWDARTAELHELVHRYDTRLGRIKGLATSATGTVFEHPWLSEEWSGIVFMPTYNLYRITTESFEAFFKNVCRVDLAWAVPLNFVWTPFNVRAYREAHVPFADAFLNKHGVSLDAILLVITALCQRVFHFWTGPASKLERMRAVLHYWQRAYEGPHIRELLWDEVEAFVPLAARCLGLEEMETSEPQIRDAAHFLELDETTRAVIDLGYPGPHSIFLPYGDDRVFVDYAYLLRRLYELFHGVQVSDQNFKGGALERLVRHRKSLLPSGSCKSMDGSQRQIDAAFELDGRLVLVECKAIARSIGFDRGDPEAIQYRVRRVDRLLEEVDEKARWLAGHPHGRNYDVRDMREILSVGVTPFVEYMPSLSSHYWLTHDLPRVLTPDELEDALEDGTLAGVSHNVVPIGGTA